MPWFVAAVAEDMKQKPPAPISLPPKKRKRVAPAKPEKATPKKASFKRTGRGKGKSLSPLAKAVQKKKKQLSEVPKPASESCEPIPAPTPLAESGVLAKSPVTSYSEVSLEEFTGYLGNLGIPQELLPSVKPSGTKGYTVKATGNPSSLQVLWAKKMFYLNRDQTGKTPAMQTITWNKYGSPSDAWRHCNQNLKMATGD